MSKIYFTKMKWLPLMMFLVMLSKYAHAYLIIVDAQSEECFFEKVEVDTKMNLTFIVLEGGFLDIDIKIVGPDDKTIYEGLREDSGNNTFKAYMNGKYSYCFSNLKSTIPKVIMFNMEIEEPEKPDGRIAGQEGNDSSHGKL